MKHVGYGLVFATLFVLALSGQSAFAKGQAHDREVASEPILLAQTGDFAGDEEKAFLCSHLSSTLEAPDVSDEERARVKEMQKSFCR